MFDAEGRLNTYYFGMDLATWYQTWGHAILVLSLLLIVTLIMFAVLIAFANWWHMRPNARIKSNTAPLQLNHNAV